MYAKWLAGEMDFKVCVCMGGGEAWNTEKHCRPPWLTDKKKFRILNNNILTLVTAF